METLISFGLAAAVLLAADGGLVAQRPLPTQIIYVQAAPTEAGGTGCLPLIILIAVVLFALRLS
jgi:hypothetical protein